MQPRPPQTLDNFQAHGPGPKGTEEIEDVAEVFAIAFETVEREVADGVDLGDAIDVAFDERFRNALKEAVHGGEYIDDEVRNQIKNPSAGDLLELGKKFVDVGRRIWGAIARMV